MKSFCLLLLIAVATAQDGEKVEPDVRVPPSIVEEADSEYVYRSDGEVELKCVATGTPSAEYLWYKNGEILDLSRPNIRIRDEGNLIISPATSLDEGYYQCYAQNPYGVAMTKTSLLTKATLGSYPPDIPVQEYTVTVGDELTINCDPIKSVPTATYSWAIAKDRVDESPIGLDMGKRINMDPSGNLYFANIQETDAQGGRLYKCNVYNAQLDVTTGGSYSRINVLGGGSPPAKPPTGRFQTPSPHIALVGENMELQCLFSGSTAPSITWKRSVGSLPAGRYVQRSHGSQLEVMTIREEDEGVYICTGNNGEGRSEQTISVQVEAKPVFQSKGADVQPLNINKTEGEDVTFNCNSYAIPVAEVQWLMNGKPLNPNSLPERMMISEDGTSLTVENLCKDCTTGGRNSDLMVIQCNSSNVHGYMFGSGYLNVLVATAFTVSPPQELQIEAEKILQLPCEGKTDDSTPLEYQWRFEDVKFVPEEPYTRILEDNTLEIDTNGLEGEEWKEYAGKYTCVISNGYSTEKADTLVKLPPGVKPIAGAGIGSMWWIFVIIGVILLLLILLLICCICMQRNKGDTYPVDEKERKNGNDPEKELADSGFADYQRPEDEPIKGSRASLTSTIKMDSDEEGSLAEYGDIDTGKFNEDGSFIGQYMEKNRRQPHDTTV